jgi:hypothetical protein
MEIPPGVSPTNTGGFGGFGGGFGPVRGIAVPQAPPPAPPPAPAAPGKGPAPAPPAAAPAQQVQIQVQVGPPGGGGLRAGVPVIPAPGITLVDEKGKTITQTGGDFPKFHFAAGKQVSEYTQEYKLDKDQKPAKLVFSGSKTVGLDIPFSFKDVPLK